MAVATFPLRALYF